MVEWFKRKLVSNVLQPLLNRRNVPKRRIYLSGYKGYSLNDDLTVLTIDCSNAKIFVNYLTPKIIRITVGGLGTTTSNSQVFPKNDYLTWSVILEQSSQLEVTRGRDLNLKIRSVLKDKSMTGLEALFNTRSLTFTFTYDSHLLHSEPEPAAFHGEWVFSSKQAGEREYYCGFGEKTGPLFKNKRRFIMWNTDNSDLNSSTDPIWQSCPLQIAIRENGFSHALFFDNPHFSQFSLSDFHGQSRTLYAAEGGPLCYYVIAGAELKEVLTNFSHLCGRYPLPPRWVLGHHHSRWEREESAERLLKIASGFRERHIPCDVLHIDIGHMNGYRSFTWNKKRFPAPLKTVQKLKNMGFKTVIMSDPGLKKDTEWDIYNQGVKNNYFCTQSDGLPHQAPVWPGDAAFPDFSAARVQEWWGSLYRAYTEAGVDGYWIDMNEPSTFTPRRTLPNAVLHQSDKTRPALSHKTVHNCYGLLMAKAVYQGLCRLRKGLRNFLFTRAAFAGIQRYASSWTGDNKSEWSHLRLSVPMLLNMGLSGQIMVGPDIGGFWSKPTPELFIRWMQIGAFYPFSRNHTCHDSPPQEIWYFGEQVEEICRQALKIRYLLLPYFYTHLKQACETGVPLMRPLFLEFPADKICLDEKAAATEFLIGPDLLVAPVLTKAACQRAVYLPEGNDWIEWDTCIHFKGGTWIKVDAPLEKIPLFVRKGAILPTCTPVEVSEEIDSQTPILLVFPDQSCQGRFYLDDGYSLQFSQGKFSDLLMQAKLEKKKLALSIKRLAGKLTPVLYKHRDLIIKICLTGLPAPIKNVLFKNAALTKNSWKVRDKWVEVRLKNPPIPLRLTFTF